MKSIRHLRGTVQTQTHKIRACKHTQKNTNGRAAVTNEFSRVDRQARPKGFFGRCAQSESAALLVCALLVFLWVQARVRKPLEHKAMHTHIHIYTHTHVHIYFSFLSISRCKGAPPSGPTGRRSLSARRRRRCGGRWWKTWRRCSRRVRCRSKAFSAFLARCAPARCACLFSPLFNFWLVDFWFCFL